MNIVLLIIKLLIVVFPFLNNLDLGEQFRCINKLNGKSDLKEDFN